jgi:hypothetical protein
LLPSFGIQNKIGRKKIMKIPIPNTASSTPPASNGGARQGQQQYRTGKRIHRDLDNIPARRIACVVENKGVLQ